jgi:hypothetical protein
MLAIVVLAQLVAAAPAPSQPAAAPVVLGGGSAVPASGAPRTLADVARERKLNREGASSGSFSVATSTVVKESSPVVGGATAWPAQGTPSARGKAPDPKNRRYEAYLALPSTKAAIEADKVAPLAGVRGRVLTEDQFNTGNLNGRPSAPGQLSDGLGSGAFVPPRR